MKALLLPLSRIFAGIVFMRNRWYDVGFLKTYTVDAFVVSVGSLFSGGSGKTPAAEFLARRLTDLGYQVAVLSRGYGRPDKSERVVYDRHRLETNVALTGDEPLMLARRFSQDRIPICVVVGPDKRKTAEIAVARLRCNALVLDDGFQSRQLHRDLDVVAWTEHQAASLGSLLPHGDLRESVSALQRADLVWIVSNGSAAGRSNLPKGLPTIRARFEPLGFRSLRAGKSFDLNFLRKENVVALSGISSHRSFRKTLESTGAIVAKSFDFEDHHRYTSADLAQIFAESGEMKIVTTEKDSVRIPDTANVATDRIFYLVCRTTVSDESALDQHLIKGLHVGTAG